MTQGQLVTGGSSRYHSRAFQSACNHMANQDTILKIEKQVLPEVAMIEWSLLI